MNKECIQLTCTLQEHLHKHEYYRRVCKKKVVVQEINWKKIMVLCKQKCSWARFHFLQKQNCYAKWTGLASYIHLYLEEASRKREARSC